MKKTIFFLLAIFCLGCAAKQASPDISGFETTPGWNKLDGRLKQAWKEAVSKNQLELNLEILIKTNQPISNIQEKNLSNAGFVLRTKIKKINVGLIKVQNLPEVANLKCVIALELAVPMSLK